MRFIFIFSLLVFLTGCGDQLLDSKLPQCEAFANAWPNNNIEVFITADPEPECSWNEAECEIQTIGEKHLTFYCDRSIENGRM